MIATNLVKSDSAWNRYRAAANGRAFLNRSDARIFTGRTRPATAVRPVPKGSR